MKTFKKGQVVKFHTPNIDEDPNQTYLVLEFREDGQRSRVLMEFMNWKYSITPTTVVYAKDLVVDEELTLKLAPHIKKRLKNTL